MEARSESLTQTGNAFGTPAYRGYILGMLALVYTFSSMDRLLIGVIAQPIIDDFRLQDWEFGLLSGFGFMVTYTLAGIPIARVAETRSRVRIIALSLFSWSVMTMLCGVAWGFVSLLLFRVGVGIGEAGCVPPANSLIGDYYPARSRAKAIAIFGLGVPVGGICANLFGGPIADALSWRHAFVILAAPGIPVAILLWFTAREPPRGFADAPGTADTSVDSFKVALGILLRKPTFWWVTVASLLASVVGGALSNFQAPLFQRLHEISVGDVAIQFVLPMATGAGVGAFAAGWVTEKLSARHPNTVAWFPAVCILGSTPMFLYSMSAETILWGSAAHATGATLLYTYLGNQYSIIQGVVKSTSRATAVAVFLLMNNLLGSGLGPLVTGVLSDLFSANAIAASPYSHLSVADCKGSIDDLVARLGPSAAEFCREVTRDGLQRSLLTLAAWCIPITGVCFLVTCRYLQRDLVAKMA